MKIEGTQNNQNNLENNKNLSELARIFWNNVHVCEHTKNLLNTLKGRIFQYVNSLNNAVLI